MTDFDPRTVPVSWSWLKGMAKCPAMARHIASQPDGGEQSLAMRMGSGLAAEVLGTPYVVYPGRKQGKAWEAFEAEHADVPILNAREHGIVLGMANALRNHPVAAPLLFGPGVEHEVPMSWKVDGRAYRTRGVDFIKRGAWVGELKQARTVQPGWFERDRLRELYPCQVELYDEGEALITKRDRDRHPLKKYIVAVEPTPPYLVTVFYLDPIAVDFACHTIGLYRSQLRSCEASGEWPGYALAPVPFEVRTQPTEDDDEELAPDAGPFDSANWPDEAA